MNVLIQNINSIMIRAILRKLYIETCEVYEGFDNTCSRIEETSVVEYAPTCW